MRTFVPITAIAGFLVLLAIPAPGQAPGKDGNQQKTPGCISGQVLIDGLPGAGITVTAYQVTGDYVPGRAAAETTTDETGQYLLSGLAPDHYFVDAADHGLVRVTELRPTEPMPSRPMIGVSGGKTTAGIDLALIRGGIITGRVVGPDGEPVGGRSMSIDFVEPDGNSAPARVSSMIITDDDGSYIVRGLPPGNYQVGVFGDAHMRASKLYPNGYYPNATSKAGAMLVQVLAGLETSGIEVRLAPPVEAHQASGRLIDAQTGKPVGNLEYLLDYRGAYSRPNGSRNADSNGLFELKDLPPGHYSILVTPRPDLSMFYYGDPIAFDIRDRDISGLDVKLVRSLTVTGKVTFSETSPPNPGANGGKPLKVEDIHLNIAAISDSLNVGTACEAKIGADGGLTITGVIPGRLFIEMSSSNNPKGFSLVRLERGGKEIDSGELTISLANATTPIQAVVGYGDVTLHGRVNYRRGTTSGTVPFEIEARPVSRDATGAKARPDWQGRFAIEGLSNGDYELICTYGVNGLPIGTRKQRFSVVNGHAPSMDVALDDGR